MTKTQIVSAVASKTDFAKKDVESIIDTFIATIVATMKTGDKVTITTLGTFQVKQYKARTGRNPQTGAAVKIPAKKKPVFRFSKPVKESCLKAKIPAK